MRKIAVMVAVLLGLWCARSEAQFPAAPGTGPGLAETIEAIDSARVTTRILYVTAHPDDESGAVLTYLARGLHADVALLSLTRGEGGQNALGPEQAPQLGLIRTQELLAATRGYGVKLYFTGAKDFGFSKTPEETEKIWGEEVTRQMVALIRALRPNVVINGWGGVHQGHGHHQAAGLLTPKAVQLAADPSYQVYPGCVDCPEDYTWGSATNQVAVLDLERGSEKPTGYVLPLDEISSLWGKSWREIGLDAFVNHRTQGIAGFINSPFLLRPIALKREDGKPFDPALLSRPLSELTKYSETSGCEVREGTATKVSEAEKELGLAREDVLSYRQANAAERIADTALTLRVLADRHNQTKACLGNSKFDQYSEYDDVRRRAERALRLVSGFSISTTSDQAEIVKGETLQISVTERCRPEVKCEFEAPEVDFATGIKVLEQKKTPTGTIAKVLVTGEAVMRHGWSLGEAEGSPTGWVDQKVRISGYAMNVEQEIEHVASSSTSATLVPLRIAPEFYIYVEPRQRVVALPGNAKPFDLFVRVHSNVSRAQTLKVVTADVPLDWTATQEEVTFEGKGDKYVRLSVTPPKMIEPGVYEIKPYAKRDLPATKIRPYDSFYDGSEPLPSMPTLTWEEPAQTIVHAFDIKVPERLRVGYISAESEPVPDALKRLGINVEMLDANALNFGELSKYDAIVVGVRAYELRSELPGANQRLLDYAKNGGTLVVQYQRDFAWDGKDYAPYPAKITPKQGEPLPRITDETSPVKVLKPDDPLLNTPNKITQDDFKGWVQERGLYFWSEYDPKYTALLAMNDPGEKDLDGSLVYTKYGKGTYIYTGIAFFRQLPEGVPGAYRLFVNLLAASRAR